MGKTESHGFDLDATRERLEAWYADHLARHRGGGDDLPKPSSDAIRAQCFEHWRLHGVDETAPRCLAAPCRVLGVALALLEIVGREVGAAELEDACALRRAASVRTLPEALRAELIAHAEAIEASPLSRAVATATAGRPKRLLAQAVAQQLHADEFSYREIAELMEAKAP